MNRITRLALGTVLLLLATGSLAQTAAGNDADSLRMAALEALITAPPERALPIVDKVLAGNHSAELKERALFILSQIESPESQARLLAFASDSQGELRTEAIRMIGIGGDETALASLGDIYRSGDAGVRDAVLEAYLIAGDADAVFDIATSTQDEEAFSNAVGMLGAMGAHTQLRELRNRAGLSDSLIEAYAISGDADSLRELAMNDSNPAMQLKAIEALGIVGGADVSQLLVDLYRRTTNDDVRDSALQGMLIAGHDAGVLELYRNAKDAAEKRRLLEYLVIMDSDAVWDLIDTALEGAQ
ncbi:MAG: HEAT repeat domain-containing protein [Gammaproteobacteria bacterium]|nr:HEAT repeat domain-containing protein [Gammaproteobacteria bacterium]MDH5617412.1 HEAT repeat domain-containing protein [Gammaproteobacteria bacterium]